MRGIFLAVAILLACVSEASADCGGRVRTFSGQTVDRNMTIKAGRSCIIRFTSSGPTEGVRIDQRPNHGIVDIGSIGKVRYRPSPGYVGTDVFVYTRYGQDKLNNPSQRSVRVNVTVTP